MEITTDYGRLVVGPREMLFNRAIELISAQRALATAPRFEVALTGGATPQEWYRWCVENRTASENELRAIHFTVSDERCVPLHNEQSNFGQAERLLLDPLGIPAGEREPWPVHLLPTEAAASYSAARKTSRGSSIGYDVCMLGMGDDGHTASIFPGSTLFDDASDRAFAAVDVPGKGWRLTITPSGLATCGLIVVMILGPRKSAMLNKVFTGNHEPRQYPVQILRNLGKKVVWLTDQAP